MYRSVRYMTAMALVMPLLLKPVPVAAESAVPRLNLLELPSPVMHRASSSVLFSVARAGARLVACGESGLVLLSDDNGKNWRQAKVPVSVALTRVRFISPKLGWAVGHGGAVLQTSDGGETWALQLTGEKLAQIELAAARAKAEKEKSGDGQDLANAQQLVADGADKPLFDIYFADENHGLVVGAFGLIYGTHDGGKTWESLRGNIDNPKGKHLYEIHSVGRDIYLVGEQGAVYRSDMSMAAIGEVKTPYRGTFFGMVSSASGHLILYGLRGNVFRSQDRGASWQPISMGMPVTVTAGVRLADGRLILVDETGRVLLGRDEGKRFEALDVANAFSFTGVAQANDGGIVLSGVRGVMHVNSNGLTGAGKK